MKAFKYDLVESGYIKQKHHRRICSNASYISILAYFDAKLHALQGQAKLWRKDVG